MSTRKTEPVREKKGTRLHGLPRETPQEGAEGTGKSAITPKGRETRGRIFSASIRLISEQGYEATTIAGICKASGISVGSFYHHFRSKSDILLGYIAEESESLLEYYRGLEALSRRDALLACVERFFGYYARKGRNFVATFLSILLSEGRDWFEPGALSLQQIVGDCLKRGAAAGEFVPGPLLEEATVLASGMVWDLSCGWCVQGGPPGLAGEAVARFSRLLGMLAP